MNYKSVSLTTRSGIGMALSNEFDNVYDVYDAIEDSKDGEDLCAHLRDTRNYVKSFTVDRETNSYIRIKCVLNMCNNVEMLTVRK